MIGISAFTGYLGALIMKNRKLSLLTIIIGTILLISPIVVGFSVGCSLYYKDNKYHSIPYIVGLIIWGVGLAILNNVNNKYYYNNYSSFNTAISPTMNKQYSTINVPTGFNQPKQSFFGKMFSRSNDSKPIDYTPQITVPTEPNTQPKQSFFSKMFKKSPESTVSVPSAITVPPTTVPQNPTTSASITVPPTTVLQPKQSFLSKINPFSKSSAAPVATTAKISPSELIKTKTKIIEDIQRTSLNQTNKNKLINKITSSTNSNIVQRLNEAYKELDKLKSTK